jgi:non-specific serine/threonine protein kinase
MLDPGRSSSFGELLRNVRAAAGLTQEGLAGRSGVSPRTIQDLEGGRAQPRRFTAERLADALGLTEAVRAAFEIWSVPPPRRRTDEPLPRDEATLLHNAADDREPVLMALPRPSPTTIPRPVTSLLGREVDLAAVRDLIVGEHRRLVTLTGVGGSGKTRLAIQVAADLLDVFVDGIWFVELASISSPVLVPRVVAGTLGVREVQGASLVDTLLGALRHTRSLVVLDNCEHLVDACAELAERLLPACPELCVLATSREPLKVTGERQWRVRPLAIPTQDRATSLGELAGCAAVQLFVERARAVEPDFVLTDANATAVARICTRLDGIPLALELAASRVWVLTVEQIAGRLDDCVRLLTGGIRAGPTRQQTLQAALDWSHDLLTEPEQALFRRLAVFAGGCELEMAEAICDAGARGKGRGASDDASPSLLDLLGSLVDTSRVVVDQATPRARYRLLEPVRQYAQRMLDASGETEPVRARHAEQYATLAERVAPELRGPAQLAWLGQLDLERDNMWAALAWILERGDAETGLRLAAALAPYWEGRGSLSEGRRWLDAALSAAHDGSVSRVVRLRALFAKAGLAQWLGALDEAETLLNEGLTLARGLGDRPMEAELLASLSTVYRRLGAPDRALALAEESLLLSRTLDHTPGVAFALLNLGMALRHLGEAVRAVPALEESVRLYRSLTDVRGVAIAQTLLGWAVFDVGDAERAGPILLDGVHQLRAVGDQGFIVVGLKTLAGVACARGEPRRGAEWFAAAEALRVSLGVSLAPRDHAIKESFLTSVRVWLTPAELAEATDAGAAMCLDQVLADVGRAWPSAATSPAAPTPAPAPPESLTRRERDVARLIAHGYTDRQIAAELSIALGTVGVHVHHILTKLDLRSRWQVAEWAAARVWDS